MAWLLRYWGWVFGISRSLLPPLPHFLENWLLGEGGVRGQLLMLQAQPHLSRINSSISSSLSPEPVSLWVLRLRPLLKGGLEGLLLLQG